MATPLFTFIGEGMVRDEATGIAHRPILRCAVCHTPGGAIIPGSTPEDERDHVLQFHRNGPRAEEEDA